MLIKQILFGDERLARDDMSFYIVEPLAGTERTVRLNNGYGVNYELPETAYIARVSYRNSGYDKRITYPNGKVYWSSSQTTTDVNIGKILPKGMYFWCEDASYSVATITYVDDCIFEVPKSYIEANLIE